MGSCLAFGRHPSQTQSQSLWAFGGVNEQMGRLSLSLPFTYMNKIFKKQKYTLLFRWHIYFFAINCLYKYSLIHHCSQFSTALNCNYCYSKRLKLWAKQFLLQSNIFQGKAIVLTYYHLTVEWGQAKSLTHTQTQVQNRLIYAHHSHMTVMEFVVTKASGMYLSAQTIAAPSCDYIFSTVFPPNQLQNHAADLSLQIPHWWILLMHSLGFQIMVRKQVDRAKGIRRREIGKRESMGIVMRLRKWMLLLYCEPEYFLSSLWTFQYFLNMRMPAICTYCTYVPM